MVHKYKDVIIAWANGEQIQFAWTSETPNKFYDYCSEYTPHFNHPALIWRIKPKKTYCIGNEFLNYHNSRVYLLALISNHNICNICALINISTGMNLNSGIIVNDPYNITEEEFNKISLGEKMIPVEMSAVCYNEIQET